MKQSKSQTTMRSPVRLRCDSETVMLIQQLAASEGISKSEAIRRLIHAGMHELEIRKDPAAHEKELQVRIQAAVQETMKPYMERLAAMSAKAAQIAGANFFLSAYISDRELPGNVVPGLASRAYKMGVEYLNMKRSDLDVTIMELLDHGQ